LQPREIGEDLLEVPIQSVKVLIDGSLSTGFGRRRTRGRAILERAGVGWSCTLRGERVSVLTAIVCLLGATLVRGAFGVFAPARPGYGLVLLLQILIAELLPFLAWAGIFLAELYRLRVAPAIPTVERLD